MNNNVKNNIILNVDRNKIDDRYNAQPIIRGQRDYYKFTFTFVDDEGNILNNPNWTVSAAFERADGEQTNYMLVSDYSLLLDEWVSAVIGILKVSVRIKYQDETKQVFPIVRLKVYE